MKMKKSLLIMASIASSQLLASANTLGTSPCGLVISNTKSTVVDHNQAIDQYPVTLNLTTSASSACTKTTDIFTVQMKNGEIKSFKKRSGNKRYWYGEDENDGSTFNYLFDDENGDFLTGSLTDFSTGDIVQFRKIGEEGNLFAFIKNSDDFGED